MNRVPAVVFVVSMLSAGVALAASGSAPEDFPPPGETHLDGSRETTIEMSVESRRPMIELMVNGRGPFKFVVDTGASLSVIDAGIAQDLGLAVVGTQVLRSPGASQEIQGSRVQVGTLKAGGLSIEGPVLATMDLVGFSAGTIEGVLGRPHFDELLLTFDYPGSKLVVNPGALDASDPATVSFDDEAGSVRFPVDVAGVSVPMVLDTGSPGGFTLPKALESRLEFRSPLEVGPTIQLVGGAHPSWRGSLDGTIRLGAIGYEGPEVVLTTIADDFGNIGFEVLRELRVTLDQKNRLIRFVRQEAPAPVAAARERAGDAENRPADARRPWWEAAARGGVRDDPHGLRQEAGWSGRSACRRRSPADRAGLRVEDIVLSVGGTAVADVEGIPAIGSLMQGPRPLTLELLRAGERLTIAVD